MKKQSTVIFLFVLSILILSVLAVPPEQIQPIDGRQRNKISPSVSSGGGGGGTATTNGSQVFSGNNSFTGNNAFSGSNTHSGLETFTGTVSLQGPTNLIGNAGTTNYYLGYNWSGSAPRFAPGTDAGWLHTFSATKSAVYFDNAGGSGSISWGDVLNSPYIVTLQSVNDMQIRSVNSGNLVFMPQSSTATLTMSQGTTTIGNNSSHAYVMPGQTWTWANGGIINGMLAVPPSSSGTTTNNGNMFVKDTLTVSNLASQIFTVVTNSALTGGVNTGVNTNYLITVNAGAGWTAANAQPLTQTNMMGTTPAVNIWTTNNTGTRVRITMGVALPSSATAVSGVSFWSIDGGGRTNQSSIVTSSPGVVGEVVTNYLTGVVGPNQPFVFTNINTVAGAPTAVVPNYVQEQY